VRLIAIVFVGFLISCTGNSDRIPGRNSDSAESLGISIGQIYHVKTGFYKGCSGVATQYLDMDYNNDTVTLYDVTCPNVTVNYITTEAKNLRKD